MYMEEGILKNKVVTKLLAYMMASAILATTITGGLVMQPVTVMAEETGTWSPEAMDTNEVNFGTSEDWDTWDNTLKASFNGNGMSVDKGSTLSFVMTMDEAAFETMSSDDYIKMQAVFFKEDNKWDTVVKLGWPMYKAADFEKKQDGMYSTTVTMSFGENLDNFYSVLIQGVGTGFEGKVTISEAKIISSKSDTPAVSPTEPTVAASFDENITGWTGESGWDYSAGKDDPAKNGTTPVEAADVSWDADTKSLKMSLDYSKDTVSRWSEAKVTGNFNAVDVSNYNIITFKLRYPSSMDSVRTKLFMKSTDDTTLLNAEGSFRSKTVENLGNGWSVATIRGEFQPQEKTVESLTIGIVGPYADLKEVYIDDVTFGQLDASEDYVKITEKLQAQGDQADLSKMATEVKLVDSNATDSAKALAAYLAGLQAEDQVLFGHQNSTFRSVRDNGVTSDVKDVTGSEAGLFGIDTLSLAGTECASEHPLQASIAASKKAYDGGSIISLSCHMPNFTSTKITETGDKDHPYDFSKCDFAESKDLTPCADYILEGGAYNAQYNAYLDIIAEYALALQKEKVPILFRPFHENSGGWFWWGTSTSADSYRAIWRYMVNYLQAKGVHNMLYVYSPNGPIDSETDYLSRFPGDAYVDVLGFDFYDDYADADKYTGDTYFEALAKSCDVVANLAKKKNKIPAIAETGIRITGAGKDSLMVTGNPTTGKDWYNKLVNTAVDHNIPYFLLWANFSSENFFIPYKFNDTMGQEMINEFISAYNNDRSIFGNGTNFYGDNGAISKADQVTLSGYSDSVSGYMISPKNYAVIKSACEWKAFAKNAEKVEFIIKTSETDNKPIVLKGTKEEGSSIYTAHLTEEKLASIPKTGTGMISVVAYANNDSTGTNLGTAKFINFNQDAAVMPAQVIDNFEYYYGNDGLFQTKYGTHNSAAGCSAKVTLDADNKVEGSYGCAFNYTLVYKGSEAWTGGLGRTFDTKDFSKYNAVSMWVKPDGNGQKLVVQLRDSSGKEYEALLTDFVKGTQAQYVTIPFSSFKVKGGTDSISSSDIAGFFLWCNTVPDNIAADKKDDKGNYTVNGSIVLDDIKAVKISESDLAKVESGKTFLTSDTPLTDLSHESQGSGSAGTSTPSGSAGTSTPSESTGSVKDDGTTPKEDDAKESEEKIQIKDDSGKVTVTVTVKKNADGTVASAAATVSQSVKKGNKLSIDADAVRQIQENAGTKNVSITIAAKDSKGNTKYKIRVQAADLVKGKKLVIYQYNAKTGEYVAVNAKKYKVATDGSVTVAMDKKKTYVLVSESEAKAINRDLKAAVQLARTSATVSKERKFQIRLDSDFNTDNIKSIKYVSGKASIAKVDKKGNVTAQKSGTTVIKVIVTLNNGTKKTMKMNFTVK